MEMNIDRQRRVDLSFRCPAIEESTRTGGSSRRHSPAGPPISSGRSSPAIPGSPCRRSATSVCGSPAMRIRSPLRDQAGAFTCRDGLVLDMGNSGTSLRLITTPALLCEKPVTITGSTRMRERPVGPLVDALNALGGSITYLGEEGRPPLLVRGELRGGETVIDSRVSSQFVSSVLLTAPYAREDVSGHTPVPACLGIVHRPDTRYHAAVRGGRLRRKDLSGSRGGRQALPAAGLLRSRVITARPRTSSPLPRSAEDASGSAT